MKELKGDKMKNFDISVFKTLYNVNENTINKIKGEIYSKIDILDKDSKLNLLLIGPGYGRLEIPLIQLLLKKNKKLDIIAVDPSNKALSDFKKELKKVILSCKITDKFEEFESESKNNNNQIVLLLLNKKIEKCIEDSNNIFQENKYHIITAFFVMQNVSRLFSVAEKIILSLKENGFLIFGEEQGYCKFVDGLFETGENFDDIGLLKAFHEYRNTLRKPWEFHPVKASDHSIFSNILKAVGFSKEIDQTIEIENLPYIEPEQLFKVFTPFQAWLREEEKNNWLRQVGNVGKAKSNNTRIEKIRFLIFKKTEKFSEKEFKKSIKNILNDYIYKNLYSLILLPFSLNDFLSSMKPPDFRSQNYENLIKLRLYFLGELFYNFFSDKVHLDYILYFHDFYFPEKSKYIQGLPVLLMFGDEDNLYLLSYSLYFYVKKILNIETFIEYLWKNYPDYTKIEVIKGNTFNVEEILFENSSLKGLKITLPEFNKENEIKSYAKGIFNCIKNQYKMKDIFYPFEEFINPISSLSNQNQEFENEVKNIYNKWFEELQKNNKNKYEENFYKHLFSFYFIGILSEFAKWEKITFYINFIFLQNSPKGFSSLTKITFDTDKIEDELEDIFMKNLWCRFGAFDALYASFYNVRSQVLSHALRSAVAAIMSRNMSHNIGSHVLAKMGYASFAELNLPQSQILYKYMQQRMDFVAITSTEFPQWSYPTWFLKELMRWFYQQETLLEFIAKQEGIKGSYKWAKRKDDEENKNTLIISIRYNNRYNNKWIIHENQAYTEPEGLKNDFLLAIPGGIIGYHAFYVILEDIIRNSAKHNWASLSHQQKEEKKQLRITIDIENKEENDFVTFRIYDNISETENILNLLPSNYEELTPEKMEKLPLHQKMNVYLTRSFIDNTGQLKKENWGLQEMKISAGYLNKSNVEDIGKNGEEVLDILKAVAVKDPEENDKYRLGYEFKIPKPKTVAIIGKKEKIKEKFNTSEAKKHGIYYFENTPPDFDYEFMILINDGENEVLTNLLNNPEYEIEKLPYRLFVLTDREIPPQIEKRVVKINKDEFSNIFNNDYEKFKIELYKKWIEKLHTKASDYSVYIDFKAPQSDKWDLELFQKCENLIKTFAKANKKNDDEINHALGKTHTDTEVKEGNTDPVAFFFSALNFDASNVNKLEKEFKNSLLFFSITQNLPHIYENGNIQNFEFGTETNAQIKIKRHDLPTGCFYGEEISGSCTHYLILFNYQKDSQLHYQILENAVFKMLIIDERVIDFIGKKTARVKQRFSNSRIIIPNSNYTGVKITINGKTYKFNWKENATENLLDLGNNMNDIMNDINLLVIHQGIIDKMECGKEKINPEEFVRKVKEKIPFVIITSGRGEPENVPKNAKFVPFSVIESTLLKDYHEKFILTQILMNLKNR